MPVSLPYWLFALGGYLVGGFPTGVVLTRRKYGIDVREMGSGNIGATNVTRVFGWYAGVLTFLIDAAKGFVPLWLIARYLPGDPWVLALTGACLVLGHCFSPYLRLHGGKGVATSLGCLLAVVPGAALAAAVVYVALLATVRISAVGSLGGIAATLIWASIVRPPPPATTLVLAIAFIVVVSHQSNIRRLLDGFRRRAGVRRKGRS